MRFNKYVLSGLTALAALGMTSEAFADGRNPGSLLLYPQWDWLIGNLMGIRGIEAFGYSMNPVAFKGIGDGEFTNQDNDSVRDLDGMEYEQLPDEILIPRFLATGFGFESELILLGLSGGFLDAVGGATFDELRDDATGEVYTSGAGMLRYDQRNYRDYGLFSTFPGPSGNQFMIVAGTRDAGVMHVAQALSSLEDVTALEQRVDLAASAEPPAFEAIYEVAGFDRMNLDAMVVYWAPLDVGRIWRSALIATAQTTLTMPSPPRGDRRRQGTRPRATARRPRRW